MSNPGIKMAIGMWALFAIGMVTVGVYAILRAVVRNPAESVLTGVAITVFAVACYIAGDLVVALFGSDVQQKSNTGGDNAE